MSEETTTMAEATLSTIGRVMPLIMAAVMATGAFFLAQAESVEGDSILDKRVTALEQLNELKINRDIQELRTEVKSLGGSLQEQRSILLEQKARNDAIESIMLDVRRELRMRNTELDSPGS